MKNLKRLVLLVFAVCSLSIGAAAQKKSWADWDKKDVDKMLNTSGWSHVQHDTDTSEMMYQPTSSPTSGNDSRRSSRAASGATNGVVDVTYGIRFFSARPIREAYARNILLANPNIKPAQLQNFVDGDYSQAIVVAVTYDSTDQRSLGPVREAFGSATSEKLKNTVYLERKDGKRIFLDEYALPEKDGTGAKFVFPRLNEGHPFFEGNDETLRFYADLGKGVVVTWKFKLADMMYNGKMEY